MMRSYLKWVLLALLLCQAAVTAWVLFAPPHGASADPVIDAKYFLIRPGMSLKQVETIMGPAGPNYSSDIRRGHFIWKNDGTWVDVQFDSSGVTDKQMRQGMDD